MNNVTAAAIFCGRLCRDNGERPFGAKEWRSLCAELNAKDTQPYELAEFTRADLKEKLCITGDVAERILSLSSTRERVIDLLADFESKGIFVTADGEATYPERLIEKLGASCPPVLYYSGSPEIAAERYAGFVGSRNAEKDDLEYARFAVARCMEKGYGVVSGGARGVDFACEESCLQNGGKIVSFTVGNMNKRLKESAVSKALVSGRALIFSIAPPDEGFNLGIAMMRNRYIYALSRGTVVVRSDYNKGGTWAGATDNLKNGWCKLLCRKKSSLAGNEALIEKGAVPIDHTFDGEVEAIERPEPPVQLSLF